MFWLLDVRLSEMGSECRKKKKEHNNNNNKKKKRFEASNRKIVYLLGPDARRPVLESREYPYVVSMRRPAPAFPLTCTYPRSAVPLPRAGCPRSHSGFRASEGRFLEASPMEGEGRIHVRRRCPRKTWSVTMRPIACASDTRLSRALQLSWVPLFESATPRPGDGETDVTRKKNKNSNSKNKKKKLVLANANAWPAWLPMACLRPARYGGHRPHLAQGRAAGAKQA